MRCVLFPSLDLAITTAMNYKKSSSHCFFCQLFVQSFLISVARANDAVSHLSNVTPSFSYSKFHFKNCHFKYWSFDVEIYIEPLSFFFADSHLTRKVPASYSDGVYMMGGLNRPNPRKLSELFMKGPDGLGSVMNRTALFAFFGTSFLFSFVPHGESNKFEIVAGKFGYRRWFFFCCANYNSERLCGVTRPERSDKS